MLMPNSLTESNPYWDASEVQDELIERGRTPPLVGGSTSSFENSRRNDKAFNPNIALKENSEIDMGVQLGLRLAPNQRKLLARNSVLLNVIASTWTGTGWVYYSRDHDHYAKVNIYFPKFYSARNIKWVVDNLENSQLIKHEKTRPSKDAEFRSRIRATEELVLASNIKSVDEIEYRPFGSIILKDSDKNIISYKNSRRISQMRREVVLQNNFLSAQKIDLTHSDWTTDTHGFLRSGGKFVNPKHLNYYRVFNNERWSLGGRFYGPFWQQLPGDVREHLTINGEPVIELDFFACQPRLLYAKVGRTMPEGDPYEIGKLERKLGKIAFQILLNSPNQQIAIKAISNLLILHEKIGNREAALEIIKFIKLKHPDLETQFCTGVGLQLQRVDSDMCSSIQRQMRELGIPVLSVHDSFIAPESSENILNEVRTITMDKTLKKLRFNGS